MFKVCPECRGEFQAWVARCPDCDVALVGASEPLPPAPAPRELPPPRELICVERGEPWHLRELAEQLQAEGVSCRIDVFPPDAARAVPRDGGATRFGLYVRPEQLPAAEQIRNAHLQRVVPDAAELVAETGAELSACPACGATLVEGATACETCGLEFPELGAED